MALKKVLFLRKNIETGSPFLLRRLIPDVSIAVIGLNPTNPYADISRDTIEEELFIDLIGLTATMREVVTLFTAASVFITNNSRPVHFAFLTEFECLTHFGQARHQLAGSQS